MIDVDVAANEIERLALQIFAAMEDGTIGDAVESLCTPDFRWENSGLPTVVGAAGYREITAAGGFGQHIRSSTRCVRSAPTWSTSRAQATRRTGSCSLNVSTTTGTPTVAT